MGETILVVLLGIAVGTITGLVPGLHVNTLLALTLFALPEQLQAQLALGIVALAVTHSFVGFIPSTLLGIPTEDKALSVLPGHYFAKKGLALHAIRLTTIGGFFGLLCAVAFTPFLGKLLEQTFEYFLPFTPIALAAILASMVWREKTPGKKAMTLLVVALSALSGVTLLNNSLFTSNLFVLVTGFFTVPGLLLSFAEKNALPKQSDTTKKIRLEKAARAGFLSGIASCFTVFLPAIGPNEAILASANLSKKPSRTKYLMLSGGVTTANFVTSFAALFLIGKTRTGAAVFLKQALPLTDENFFLAMATVITAGALAAMITETLAKTAVKKFEKTDYNSLSKAVFAFVLFLVFFLSGPIGFLALFTASCIGLLAVSCKVNRSTCMAFLIAPAILFYVTR